MHTVSAQSFTSTSEGSFAATALDVLEDYLASCKDACDGEIHRIYGSGQRGSSGLHELILDYPLRGGKALRPALSIATCLGLGGASRGDPADGRDARALPQRLSHPRRHRGRIVVASRQAHDAHRPRHPDRRQRRRRHALAVATAAARQRRARRSRAGAAHPASRSPT